MSHTYWLGILFTMLVVYLAISVLIYYLQEFFLFKPEKLPKDFQYYYENQEIHEYNLTVKKGVVINGLRFKTENPKGVVFYLKGNSKSIKGWGKFAVDFTRQGYDVIMVDYRGFGKSTGRRSEKGIINDMQYVYDKIKEQVAEKYIILYGRSLGSGFATKLACSNNPKMLILDAPYYSLSKVAGRFMPFMPISLLMRFPIPTYKWIKNVVCPVHIIHGSKDRLIPIKSSMKLASLNTNSQLYTVLGGGHKNMTEFKQYHEFLDEILNKKKKTINLEGSTYEKK